MKIYLSFSIHSIRFESCRIRSNIFHLFGLVFGWVAGRTSCFVSILSPGYFHRMHAQNRAPCVPAYPSWQQPSGDYHHKWIFRRCSLYTHTLDTHITNTPAHRHTSTLWRRYIKMPLNERNSDGKAESTKIGSNANAFCLRTAAKTTAVTTTAAANIKRCWCACA